mgnify:CR=1 FL=1
MTFYTTYLVYHGKTEFNFDPKYAYVMAVLIGSAFVNLYLIILVDIARHKYNVKYPVLYADHTHPHHVEYNSAQRGH